jgi:Flp pilus assembly pilin Flp
MMVDRIELNDQKGQAMAEYAILLGMITFAIVTTISLMSDAVRGAFQQTLDIVTSVI